MNAIVDLREYALRKAGVLVLVDMHEDVSGANSCANNSLDLALSNCRRALAHARARGAPIAFVRRRASTPDAIPKWQVGFTPRRNEMLFERAAHSCYASEPFLSMVEAAGGRFALAGLFGETSCIATAMDAVNRGHRVTFLADASYSRGLTGVSAPEVHRAITSILSLHGTTITTHAWVSIAV